jgi:hypothetical protein
LAGDVQHGSAEIDAGERHVCGVERKVQADADRDFEHVAFGVLACPCPVVLAQETALPEPICLS